jgi:hypothetical protein
MKAIQRLVVMVLLGVWFFPAVSFAEPLPTTRAEGGSRASSGAASTQAAAETERGAFAAREKQAQDVQNFKGGDGYIYIGGGATLVLLIILLVLLL